MSAKTAKTVKMVLTGHKAHRASKVYRASKAYRVNPVKMDRMVKTVLTELVLSLL